MDAADRLLDHRIVTQQERTQVLLEHSKHFEGLWGEKRFPAMRKHLAWYCKGFRGAARWRTQMVRAKSVRDVEEIITRAMSAPPTNESFEAAAQVEDVGCRG